MVRLIALLCLLGGPALGQGFAVTDLTRIHPEAALGEGWTVSGSRQRQTIRLVCAHCAGDPRVDVTLGRLTDRTEADIRQGRLSIRALQRRCRARSPGCQVEGLPVAPAVGWMTRFSPGEGNHAAILIALRNGDHLSVSVLATDPGVARDIARRLVRRLLPVIIGT